MTPYFLSDNGDFCLYGGDTFDVLKTISTKVDMIFADPPYFLSTGFVWRESGRVKCFDKGDWDKERSAEEVDKFNMEWLSLCRDILKDDGCIWVSGTYHNIASVSNCLSKLGYKILNIIIWQKPNAPVTLSDKHFNFSAEYIIWARKSKRSSHYFNMQAMNALNSGQRMSDVWRIPTVEPWEKHYGKHPTQKPLRLLYRAILSNTKPGDVVLNPFTGSGTTGIAANLMGRRFIGIEKETEYLQKCILRRKEIDDRRVFDIMLSKISVIENEPMVIVNHVRESLMAQMVSTGICYLRAGDAKGSLLIKPGFERLEYVLLHTNGDNPKLYKLCRRGQFQIWTSETLAKYGFAPEHAPYYIVLLFEKEKIIQINRDPDLKRKRATYTPQLRHLSEFIYL